MRHPTQLHSGSIDWPKTRLLVFSLDDSFRFLARQTFRKLSVREVLSTSVPADATSMLAQVPNVALVDMDGDFDTALAFLTRVRDADPGLPVLLVARSDARARLAPALALGVEDVVPKPVSGHELVHRVGEVLKHPRRLPPPPPPPPPKIAAPKPTPASASGGNGGSGGVGAGAGSYGDAAPTSGKSGAAAGSWLDGGDPAASGQKVSGGKLAWGDDAPPAPVKTGGSYGDAPESPPPAKGKLEALFDTLPETLRPKRRGKDEEDAAEADRAKWQQELAEAGHAGRNGKDVAGLDVDAIVAAHLQWLTTQAAQGKRADFRKMDLAGAALAGTVLANAGFREADLSDAQLTEARLDGADFRYASLSAADLSAANLGVAQLRHCDLRLANLQGASLRGADLSGAKLRGAKLAGADFKGTTLVGCDLSDTDLSQVENLSTAQVEKAIFDTKTKLPPGVHRPRHEE